MNDEIEITPMVSDESMYDNISLKQQKKIRKSVLFGVLFFRVFQFLCLAFLIWVLYFEMTHEYGTAHLSSIDPFTIVSSDENSSYVVKVFLTRTVVYNTNTSSSWIVDSLPIVDNRFKNLVFLEYGKMVLLTCIVIHAFYFGYKHRKQFVHDEVLGFNTKWQTNEFYYISVMSLSALYVIFNLAMVILVQTYCHIICIGSYTIQWSILVSVCFLVWSCMTICVVCLL